MVTGLRLGGVYMFKIQAVTTLDVLSDESEVSDEIEAPDVPPAMAAPTLKDVASNTAQISWTIPSLGGVISRFYLIMSSTCLCCLTCNFSSDALSQVQDYFSNGWCSVIP